MTPYSRSSRKIPLGWPSLDVKNCAQGFPSLAAAKVYYFLPIRSQTEIWYQKSGRPAEWGRLWSCTWLLASQGRVEMPLHEKNLKLLVCTSSLSLGRLSSVDTVIQVGGPKASTPLVQGPAGQSPSLEPDTLYLRTTHSLELH